MLEFFLKQNKSNQEFKKITDEEIDRMYERKVKKELDFYRNNIKQSESKYEEILSVDEFLSIDDMYKSIESKGKEISKIEQTISEDIFQIELKFLPLYNYLNDFISFDSSKSKLYNSDFVKNHDAQLNKSQFDHFSYSNEFFQIEDIIDLYSTLEEKFKNSCSEAFKKINRLQGDIARTINYIDDLNLTDSHLYEEKRKKSLNILCDKENFKSQCYENFFKNI
jgi:hypothetical protein